MSDEKNTVNFLEIDKFIEKEYLDIIKLTDSIINVNEETLENVYKQIKENKDYNSYIENCLYFALKIRTTNAESIINLITMIYKEIRKKILGEHNKILLRRGLIKEDVEDDNNDLKFTEGSLIKAIKDDDVNLLIKCFAEPNFNPAKTYKVDKNRQIFYVKYDFNDKSNYQTHNVTLLQIMAFYGSIKCFKYAVMDESFDLSNTQDYAIAGGNKEIIQILSQKGISFDELFQVAAKFHRDEICNWLLANCQNSAFPIQYAEEYFNDRVLFLMIDDENQSFYAKEALLYAAKNGNTLICKYLVNKYHIDVNEARVRGKSALYYACNNNLPLVKYLYEECKADVQKVTESKTALDVACSNKSIDVIKYFFKMFNCVVALSDLAKIGSLELTKFIVEECKVTFDSMDSETFIYLFSHKNTIIIKYLVEDCGIKVKETGHILEYLLQHKDYQFARYLVEVCNAEITDKCFNDENKEFVSYLKNKCLLHEAVKKEDFNMIKDLIENKKCDVDRIFNGKSALQIACEKENMEIIKYLNNKSGICIHEIKFNGGRTLLYRACERNNISLVKYLIEECYANKSCMKDELAISCKNGNMELSKYLVESCNIKANDENKSGQEALLNACQSGNTELVKYLIETWNALSSVEDKSLLLINATKSNNMELVMYLTSKYKLKGNKADKNGRIALHYACECNNFDLVRYLVDTCQEDVNAKSYPEDNDCLTPLIIATINGNVDIINYLNQNKVNIDDKNNNGDTALMIACRSGNFEVVKLLVDDCKADFKLKNNNGETPYFVACQIGNFEIMQFLVDKSFPNVEEKNNNGETLIFAACSGRNFRIVKLLVEFFDSNLNIKNNRGETPLSIACKNGSSDIAAYLTKVCP